MPRGDQPHPADPEPGGETLCAVQVAVRGNETQALNWHRAHRGLQGKAEWSLFFLGLESRFRITV